MALQSIFTEIYNYPNYYFDRRPIEYYNNDIVFYKDVLSSFLIEVTSLNYHICSHISTYINFSGTIIALLSQLNRDDINDDNIITLLCFSEVNEQAIQLVANRFKSHILLVDLTYEHSYYYWITGFEGEFLTIIYTDDTFAYDIQKNLFRRVNQAKIDVKWREYLLRSYMINYKDIEMNDPEWPNEERRITFNTTQYHCIQLLNSLPQPHKQINNTMDLRDFILILIRIYHSVDELNIILIHNTYKQYITIGDTGTYFFIEFDDDGSLDSYKIDNDQFVTNYTKISLEQMLRKNIILK